jgi:hypothetical protein
VRVESILVNRAPRLLIGGARVRLRAHARNRGNNGDRCRAHSAARAIMRSQGARECLSEQTPPSLSREPPPPPPSSSSPTLSPLASCHASPW